MLQVPLADLLLRERKMKGAADRTAPFQVRSTIDISIRNTYVFLPIDGTNIHFQHLLHDRQDLLSLLIGHGSSLRIV